MSDDLSVSAVGPAEASALVQRGALLIDVRRPTTQAGSGVIPGAVAVGKADVVREFAPGATLHQRATSPESPGIVVYCQSEGGSGPVVAQLAELGFIGVVQVAGGFPAWQAAGLPVEPVPAADDSAETRDV